MTIAKLAAQLGISRQTIYNRLEKHGVDKLSIQDLQTGELTEEGERLIRQMHESRVSKTQQTPSVQTRIDSLTQACEAMSAQISMLQQQLTLVTEERNFLRQILRDKLPPALPDPGAADVSPAEPQKKPKKKKHKHRRKK